PPPLSESGCISAGVQGAQRMSFRCLAGSCLLACLGITLPCSAQIELPQLATVDNVPARFDLLHDEGQGPGFTHGFTFVNALVPFYQVEDLVFFSDLRASLFETGAPNTLGLGTGMRFYVPPLDRLAGFNIYYDNGDSGNYTFQQLGLGW